MKKAIGLIGIAIVIAVFIASFVAYFVVSFNPITQAYYDGFGRPLSESPWLVRLIFGADHLWAGGYWFVIDMIIFWGSIGLGFNLASYGLMNDKNTDT